MDLKGLASGAASIPALSTIPGAIANQLGFDAGAETIAHATVGGINKALEAANTASGLPLAEIAGGAGALSLINMVGKDIGLVDEERIGGVKNLARYAAMGTGAIAAYGAGTALAPWLIGGSIAYALGRKKFGAEGSKKNILEFGVGAAKKAIGNSLKTAYNVPVAGANALVHVPTDMVTALYQGLFKGKAIKPQVKTPAYN